MTEGSGRWAMAQEYERRHWEELARRIVEGRSDLRWYRWKAGRTLERLRACGVEPAVDGVVAEVGSGPVGQVGFLPGARRMAFDPLMEHFERHGSLLAERPQDVEYVLSRGETLPLPDGSCHLVVIDNCLDHCEDPRAVLAEIRRVLRDDGLLYITLNVRSPVGWLVREAAERVLRFDRGHPHSYYAGRLRRTLRRQELTERGGWIQPWAESFREEWARSAPRTLAKVGSLTLERLYEGVWAR